MKIVTAPHPALRTKAKPVNQNDKKVKELVQDLEKTLSDESKKGVGLAAPQINKSVRMFAFLADYRPYTGQDMLSKRLKESVNTFINPVIVKHSGKLEIPPAKGGGVMLEGCLSIPGLYGPVPRYKTVGIEYLYFDKKKSKLVEAYDDFEDFSAALVQHEIDHLDGILFTDYSLQYDLPVYQEDEQGELQKLKERSLLEVL